MFNSQLKAFVRVFAAATALASFASADIIGPGFRVTVVTPTGASSTLEFPVTLDPDGNGSWSMTEPYDMYDYTVTPPALLATLNPAGASSRICSASYISDPVVNLSFSLQNMSGSTANFMVSSALLTFPTINPAHGRASAGFSVTDGTGDGATLTGIGNPAGAHGGYLAQYNGFAGAIAGTTFTEQFPVIGAAPNATGTDSATVPLVGYNPIGAPVGDMSSHISFSLTPGDIASGTSNFEIVPVPEPASIGLLIVGFGLMRRRS